MGNYKSVLPCSGSVDDKSPMNSLRIRLVPHSVRLRIPIDPYRSLFVFIAIFKSAAIIG